MRALLVGITSFAWHGCRSAEPTQLPVIPSAEPVASENAVSAKLDEIRHGSESSLTAIVIPQAIQDPVKACETEVASALKQLGECMSACGEISTVIEGTNVILNFTSGLSEQRTAFVSGSLVASFANDPSYCILKTFRESVASELGMLKIYPIPEVTVPRACRALVSLYDQPDHLSVLRAEVGWRSLTSTALKTMANILRVYKFFHSQQLALGENVISSYRSDPSELHVSVLGLESLGDRVTAQQDMYAFIFQMLQERFPHGKVRLSDYTQVELDDPELVFLDAVERFENDFNYDFRISVFQQWSEDPKTKPQVPGLKVDLPAFPKTKLWWEQMGSCIEDRGAIGIHGLCVGLDAVCTSNAVIYRIEGLDNTEVFKIKEVLAAGTTAVVFATSDQQIVQKLVFGSQSSDCVERVHVVCSERAGMSLFEGLEGFSPRMFEAVSVPPICGLMSVFMEFVSGKSALEFFGQRVSLYNGVLFLIHGLAALQQLHEQGFVHNDAHSRNWIVEKNEKGFVSVKLIDFGFARPVVDPEGNPVRWGMFVNPFKTDIRNLIATVPDMLTERLVQLPAFQAFLFEVNRIGLFQMPNYEFLGNLLRELALFLE
jgi:hypothetical protein